jgi:hypothetical protein
MAVELCVNKSTVLRSLQKAKAEGRISDLVKGKPGRKTAQPSADFDD